MKRFVASYGTESASVGERREFSLPPMRAWLRLALEIAGLHIPFFLYFLTRGAVADRAGEAFVRGAAVVDLERRLGIFVEADIQAVFLPEQWLIDFFNGVYFWAHFPLYITAGLVLYAWHRPVYMMIRNTFLASASLGLIIYVLFPVAPPRMMPHLGFVDTMERFSSVSYQNESVGTFANPFAAVPSLHFGWALVTGIVLIWMFRHPLVRAFGVALPALQLTAIIVTGNHFFFDAFTGGIVSLAGLGIAIWYTRFRERRALIEAPATAEHLAPGAS